MGTIDFSLAATILYGKDEAVNISPISVVFLVFQVFKPDTDAEESKNISDISVTLLVSQ